MSLEHPCAGAGGSEAEDGPPLWARSRAPLLSAFWQGRLIPGARIESLPFIEARARSTLSPSPCWSSDPLLRPCSELHVPYLCKLGWTV